MENDKELFESLLAGETLVSFREGKILTKAYFDSNNRLHTICCDANYVFSESAEWHIYKEPKWYENIPEGGVLCWCKDNINEDMVVKRINEHLNGEGKYKFRSDDCGYIYATPLTKQEIQAFMDNAPEEI